MKYTKLLYWFVGFIVVAVVSTLVYSRLRLPQTEETRETAETPSLLNQLKSPPSGVLFQGIASRHSIDVYRRLFGESQPPGTLILSRFQSWADEEEAELDTIFLHRVKEFGAIPLITWEPWSSTHAGEPQIQPDFKLTTITEGKHDEYIKTYAQGLKRYGSPVFLRFAHEMNGHWYPWGGTVNNNTPEDYRAAWRHVHDIFMTEGATNVIWVWSPNEPYGGELNQGSEQFSRYYPGDAYVDWVGFSAYNWGTYRDFDVDRSFTELVEPSYTILTSYNKPMMLTETNSTSIGVDKAAWIQDMKKTITQYPRLQGIIWYENEGGPFTIEKELLL